MKGLELARAYYEACGAPMLRARFPDYAERIAVGLVGQGSECFGFDDELSTDHDFGPSFCLWLTPEDFLSTGGALQEAYTQLPKEFMGYKARVDGAHSGGRVGVHAIDVFYRNHIGRPEAPSTLVEWLVIPEFRLASAVNGCVFHDSHGEFSRIRNALLAFYPEDVRIKKIAARAALMAQSGQYNYARCMCRGETTAAYLALAEFINTTISMVFLLNKRYTPFYKWMHRAMRDLPVLAEVSRRIGELSLTGIHTESWRTDSPAEKLRTLNVLDRNVVLVEEICALVKERLQQEGLTESDEDFLAVHAEHVTRHIRDARLRSLHITEG